MKARTFRPISAFEVRSKVLFASLVLSGAASAQSAPQPPARSASAPAQQTQSAAPSAEQAAFQRADRNQDGQLSAAEAQALPEIASRLQALDTDRNASLSFEEFQRGAQQPAP